MKKLFFNGTIITMDDHPNAGCLLEEDGLISYVGTRDGLSDADCRDCEPVDLHGKIILPAFIDAHSHLSSYANSFLQASLSRADSFQSIIGELTKFCRRQDLRDGQWLIANGYDHNRLAEGRHPTKAMLDKAFPGLNVVLQHQSGHFGMMNSPAIAALGLTGKDADGYLEENLWVDAVKNLPLPSPNQLLEAYREAFKQYASYGITTVQEGMMVRQMMPLVQMLSAQNAFDLDVVGYPEIHDADLFYNTFADAAIRYDRHFRLGGVKIILDGSPQGRTAWMRTPYAGGSDEFGVSSMTDEEVFLAVQKAVGTGRQLLAHCNGDRAVEQFLEAVKKIGDPDAVAKIRPVVIHAQLLGKDQLDDVKAYGLIPSFFVAHTYYWGDIHIANFGFERAKSISPAHSAMEKGILFTFHQDTPVIEPNMFETVWCAAVRETKSGVILGEDERISVKEALKAVTINAAVQYGEDRLKGTLSKGKQANFIIVDENPLTCSPEVLKNLKVRQTYKEGECIFNRD